MRISQKHLGTLSTFMFCLYLATNALSYVSWIPKSINPISLYAFLAIASINVVANKTISLKYTLGWYGIFLLIGAFSMIYTPNKANGYDAVLQMLKIFIMLVLAQNVLTTTRKIELSLFAQSISTIVLIVDMYMSGQLFSGEQRLGGELTGNANSFASLIMLGSLSSVYFIFYSDHTRKKVIWFIAFLIQEIVLVLSGGRKFFVLPIVLLLVLFAISSDAKGRRKIFIRSVFVICCALLIAYLVMNMSFMYDAIGYRFESLLSGLKGGDYDYSAFYRVGMIRRATELWLQAPLFGNGVDSFKSLGGFGVYAHNNFVELLCDLGLVGFAAYYSYYIRLAKEFKYALEVKTGVKWYWLIAGFCMFMFDFGAVSYNIFPFPLMLIILLCGINVAGQ